MALIHASRSLRLLSASLNERFNALPLEAADTTAQQPFSTRLIGREPQLGKTRDRQPLASVILQKLPHRRRRIELNETNTDQLPGRIYARYRRCQIIFGH